MYLPAVIVGGVVVAAIIVYLSDRWSKKAPVETGALAKIVSFSGLVAGGIVFALQSEDVSEAVAAVTETAQDMFVGKPTF